MLRLSWALVWLRGAVPLSVPAEMQVTETPRYRQMLADYQLLAREQLICGPRSISASMTATWRSPSPTGGAVLPTLLALSASSPFWADGSDTGYSSGRTLVWQRWPTTGLAGLVSSAAEYDGLVADLVAAARSPTRAWSISTSARRCRRRLWSYGCATVARRSTPSC